MTDERDRRKVPHRDHSRADTPRTGVRTIKPPAYGGVSGELDSDDARMAEHFEDDTPVEVLRRIEAKLDQGQQPKRLPPPPPGPQPTVEVDAAAFDADIRWEQFDEMRAEVAACKAERLSREKRAKWLNPIRNVGIGGLIAALLWTVRALDQRGADSERARQRNEQVERALHDVRELQDWKIAVDVLMGLRPLTPTEPSRGDQ